MGVEEILQSLSFEMTPQALSQAWTLTSKILNTKTSTWHIKQLYRKSNLEIEKAAVLIILIEA